MRRWWLAYYPPISCFLASLSVCLFAGIRGGGAGVAADDFLILLRDLRAVFRYVPQKVCSIGP
jgi:hypothetical protein